MNLRCQQSAAGFTHISNGESFRLECVKPCSHQQPKISPEADCFFVPARYWPVVPMALGRLLGNADGRTDSYSVFALGVAPTHLSGQFRVSVQGMNQSSISTFGVKVGVAQIVAQFHANPARIITDLIFVPNRIVSVGKKL